jgi:hypothetical protein
MTRGKLNDEIRDALERGDADDKKSEAKKGMGRVYDGDRMAYLIRHCGIIIGVLFCPSPARRWRTTWSSGR